jgi:CBS domain-containing protein
MTATTDTSSNITNTTKPISKPSDAENHFLNVRDLITHQRLITITKGESLDKALLLMLKYDIRHLPVVNADSQDVVGIITERDLRLAAASPVIDPEIDIKQMVHLLQEHKVEECMSPSIYTASEDDSILGAAKIMRLSKRGALPVTESGSSKLIGIVTQTDMLDHLIRVLEPIVEDSKQPTSA